MKILAITSSNLFPHTARDSRGIFFANFLRHLRPLVERLAVVAPQGYVPAALRRLRAFAGRSPAPAADRYHGIEVYRPAFLSLAASSRLWMQGRSATLAVAPVCERLWRRGGFDLVMGQGFFGASHAAVCVARELGVPCVNWAIGSDVNVLPGLSDENRRLLRHDVRRSDLVLAVSADLQRRIEALCRGARHVRTFYWGIDQSPAGERGDRDARRAELGLAAGRRYMLSAGAGQREKGTREFYEAFRLLARRRGDLCAIWVGAGPELAAMKRHAEADGLGARLLLPGALPREETMKYMLSADVLAFPTWREGLPNVVLEAMACGLPVVASAVSGIPEVILDGVTGRLVPAQDAPALASAVEDALVDAEGSARMAARAQAFVRRHFDGRANARVALDILCRVAAGTALDEPLPLCAEAPPGVAPGDLLRRENQP